MTVLDDKVCLISRRWPHHARHSGYDLLGNYVGRPITTNNPVPTFILPDRFFHQMTRDNKGYDRTDLALELLAARHMVTHKENLYHFLYGDTGYNYLGRLTGWRGHRIIASYHHPPQKFWERVKNKEIIEKLSAVIIVGRNQHSIFDDILPRDRVFFVPLHVDTTFFLPPSDFSQREENLCLFVGAHLRDYDTLRYVIENAKILAPHLKFALVVHPLDMHRFKGIVGNYRIYSKLPEDELLELYQQASLFIQPLHDTTANTAVLEAISCGLPVVVSDVGAIRDYVDESCASFTPIYNPDAMLETILGLVKYPKKLKAMSTAARKRSMNYDCQVIAQRLREVYVQILDS